MTRTHDVTPKIGLLLPTNKSDKPLDLSHSGALYSSCRVALKRFASFFSFVSEDFFNTKAIAFPSPLPVVSVKPSKTITGEAEDIRERLGLRPDEFVTKVGASTGVGIRTSTTDFDRGDARSIGR